MPRSFFAKKRMMSNGKSDSDRTVVVISSKLLMQMPPTEADVDQGIDDLPATKERTGEHDDE